VDTTRRTRDTLVWSRGMSFVVQLLLVVMIEVGFPLVGRGLGGLVLELEEAVLVDVLPETFREVGRHTDESHRPGSRVVELVHTYFVVDRCSDVRCSQRMPPTHSLRIQTETIQVFPRFNAGFE